MERQTDTRRVGGKSGWRVTPAPGPGLEPAPQDGAADGQAERG